MDPFANLPHELRSQMLAQLDQPGKAALTSKSLSEALPGAYQIIFESFKNSPIKRFMGSVQEEAAASEKVNAVFQEIVKVAEAYNIEVKKSLSLPYLENIINQIDRESLLSILIPALQELEIPTEVQEAVRKMPLEEIRNWIKGQDMSNISMLNLREFHGRCKHILPEEIKFLTHLKQLIANNGDFKSVPSAIGELKKLRRLCLDGNQLTDLPSSMQELKNLRYLELSENQFSKLPESIANLPKLASLFLAENKISELPTWILQMPNLQHIDLHGNPLSPTDPVIEQLRNKGVSVEI